MEGIGRISDSPLGKTVAPLAQMTAMLARIQEADTLFLFETLLTLLKEQEREIDALKGIVTSLASENTELLKIINSRIEEMDKWRRQREPMLRQIDAIVKQRKNFLDQNR